MKEVVAYRTLRPAITRSGNSGRCAEGGSCGDCFCEPFGISQFSGDSCVTAELAALSERVQFAAIGPTTARALREAGVRVAIEANETSSAGLADAIAKYYQQPATVPMSEPHDISRFIVRGDCGATRLLRGFVRETRLTHERIGLSDVCVPGQRKCATKSARCRASFSSPSDQIVEECREVAGSEFPP